mmetsp:Transcript_23691/g.42380  ORF Transcript_23691/g.42380 Transcript_23691/m.42380 type:complete len:202 (+) Transcript_23691:449-1054(+)
MPHPSTTIWRTLMLLLSLEEPAAAALLFGTILAVWLIVSLFSLAAAPAAAADAWRAPLFLVVMFGRWAVSAEPASVAPAAADAFRFLRLLFFCGVSSAKSITSHRCSASFKNASAASTSFSELCSCDCATSSCVFAVSAIFPADSFISFAERIIFDADDFCALAAARRCLAASISRLPSDAMVSGFVVMLFLLSVEEVLFL